VPKSGKITAYKRTIMQKIIKTIYIILAIVIIAPALYFGLRYSKNTTQIYPHPYKLTRPNPREVAAASAADIILIGDSSTRLLEGTIKEVVRDMAQYLKTPPLIYNWGRAGEPMGITLQKIKALPKMPTLFIYHGGRDTFLREKFDLKQYSILKKNINLSKNETLMSLMMAYPPLSRLIYRPIKKVDLGGGPNPYPDSLPPVAVMDIMHILYQLYQQEAAELFSYLKEQDAKLWVIPQALNLTLPPRRVCENTTDPEQIATLGQAEKLKKDGRIKEAFNKINELVKVNKGNAHAYFRIGKLLELMGNYPEAKKAFYQAMIYDCGLTRSNPIFLKILMEEAEKRQFKVIDFNRMVTNLLGHNILFLNERDPQPLYYQHLGVILNKDFLKFIKQ